MRSNNAPPFDSALIKVDRQALFQNNITSDHSKFQNITVQCALNMCDQLVGLSGNLNFLAQLSPAHHVKIVRTWFYTALEFVQRNTDLPRQQHEDWQVP